MSIILIVLLTSRIIWQNTDVVPAVGGKYAETIVGQPTYINPLYAAANDADRDITQLVFSGLLKYNGQEYEPDLAEKYTIGEDQKTYTIHLKENIEWHDGEALTINDVLFTVAAIQNPNYKSPLQATLAGVKLQQVDDRTVQFQLEEPFAPFLTALTFGILPEHIWKDIDPSSASLAQINLSNPIGSGPYQFKSLAKDSKGSVKQYTIERNQHYYTTPAYLEEITFKFYPDFPSAVAALESNKVDGMSFLPQNLLETLNGKKDITFHQLALPQTTALFFNQNQNKALQDKRVRQAFAHAIDKQQLSDAIKTPIKVIEAPILEGYIGYHEEVKTYESNIDTANALLEQAGWKQTSEEEFKNLLRQEQESELQALEDSLEGGTDNISIDSEIEIPEDSLLSFYRKKGDDILAITITTVNQPEMIAVSDHIKNSLRAIGVLARIEVVPSTEIASEVITPRAYEILLYGEILGADPDPYPFWHSSQTQGTGLNLSLFSNTKADTLIEDARESIDPEVRATKYRQFQDILAAEIPAIFLYSPTYTYPLPSAIQGFNLSRISTPSDRFAQIDQWYVKTARRLK